MHRPLACQRCRAKDHRLTPGVADTREQQNARLHCFCRSLARFVLQMIFQSYDVSHARLQFRAFPAKMRRILRSEMHKTKELKIFGVLVKH
jgi:hypothetical protein